MPWPARYAVNHGGPCAGAIAWRAKQVPRRAGEMEITTTDHPEIRESVRKLCQGFPGEYWRRLDRAQAYPSEFVASLGRSGFLAALIPEAYGGAGLTLSAA